MCVELCFTNEYSNDFRFIGVTSSPKHPSPDEFWQAVHCDEYSTERCRRDSTNHATNETKGGGGGVAGGMLGGLGGAIALSA